MEINMALMWLIFLGTSIWVWVDASDIGAKKGLVKGIFDMGPLAWFLCCLLVWIIAFPIYLAKRGTIKAAAQPTLHASSQIPVADSANLKACPFCAESVRMEAIKCKHCGSELPAST